MFQPFEFYCMSCPLQMFVPDAAGRTPSRSRISGWNREHLKRGAATAPLPANTTSAGVPVPVPQLSLLPLLPLLHYCHYLSLPLPPPPQPRPPPPPRPPQPPLPPPKTAVTQSQVPRRTSGCPYRRQHQAEIHARERGFWWLSQLRFCFFFISTIATRRIRCYLYWKLNYPQRNSTRAR